MCLAGGGVQLEEMSKANNWGVVGTATAIAGILDPTGIMGVVDAYAKPKCDDHTPLLCLDDVMKNCSEAQKEATKKASAKEAPSTCTNDDKCLKAHSSWSTYDCAYSTSSGTDKKWCTKYPDKVGKCCPKDCGLCTKEFTIHVPKGNCDRTCITGGFGYKCPKEINKSNWHGGHNYADRFETTISRDEICLKKVGDCCNTADTGSCSQWGMILKFNCTK